MAESFFSHYYSYHFLNAGLVARGNTIIRILFCSSEEECDRIINRWYHPISKDTTPFINLMTQLSEYLDGKRKSFSIEYSLSLSPFYEQVLHTTVAIPYGSTATYKGIALQIGKPLAYRAVGNALHANPLPLLIPCHRVIKSDGSPGGFGGKPELKIALLKLEGVNL